MTDDILLNFLTIKRTYLIRNIPQLLHRPISHNPTRLVHLPLQHLPVRTDRVPVPIPHLLLVVGQSGL